MRTGRDRSPAHGSRGPTRSSTSRRRAHGRTRFLWQKTRWSSALHGTSTSLLWADGYSFAVEEREDVTDETIADRLLGAALEHAGATWNTIDKATAGKGEDK